MAMLKDSIITGDLRVTGTIYGDANLGSLNASGTGLGTDGQILTSTGTGLAWANASDTHNHDNRYVNVSGDTMTGVLKAYASQYADNYTTCGINMQNSDIVGLNSIYTVDASDNAGEGIHFYRDSTHVDTLWMNGGDLLFVPNRALGTATTKANSQKVGRFTTNPTSGQVVITDGTTGGMKSSGFTIAANVPSNAEFTDTTYGAEKGITLSSGKFGHSNAAITEQTTQAVYPIKIDAYGHITGYGAAQTILAIGTGASNAAAGNHNHDSTYLKLSGGTLTGALTLSGAPTENLHAVTKQYVDQSFAANDAMIFKGTIAGGSSSPGAYTTAAERGHTYKISTAGYVNGDYLETGDILICIADSTVAATSSNYNTIKANWTVVQTNLDGAVIGPTSSTDKQIAIFNGVSGKTIKGGTIGNHSYTPAGTITLTNENTTAAVKPASSGTTTYTPGGTNTAPAFTGTTETIVVNGGTGTATYTPAGSVSVSTNATTNKTTTVSAAASGETTYTPGGSITRSTDVAVNTTTVNSITAVGTASTWAFNVSNEVLTISGANSTVPTKGSNTTVATSIKTQPAFSFSGTAVRLVTGNIAVPNTYTATFTGTGTRLTASYTPAGSVAAPIFTGTAVRLVTENISRPTSATFSGTEATLTHTIS